MHPFVLPIAVFKLQASFIYHIYVHETHSRGFAEEPTPYALQPEVHPCKRRYGDGCMIDYFFEQVCDSYVEDVQLTT